MNETETKTKKIPGPTTRVINAVGWLITLVVPVVLVLTAMRLIMFPSFLRIEYKMPGFPKDPYGFTFEERVYWAEIALDYLLNDADISFLEDLRFNNDQAVYNARELRHMVDVKVAVRGALQIWVLSQVILVVTALWAWRAHWVDDYRHALARGGWLTVFLIATIIIFVLFGFGVFFVAFHNVFFEPGTWMFEYSDTLIRLFPERFWRDIFIYVGGFALVAGLAIGIGLKDRPRE